jgi:hypothetical protein
MIALHVIALLFVAPSALKCSTPATQMPGYEWRQPVILVDGVILPPDAKGIDVQPEDIASIRITCWDPATNSFELNGIPVIRIDTKALIEATQAPLLQLIRAQEEFRSRHQRHATDLKSLEAFGLATDVDLEFEASESHWNASTPSGAVAYRCSGNEASAGMIGEDGKPKLQCAPVDTLALRSLRARYDAGS